jgi:hypothetical protein
MRLGLVLVTAVGAAFALTGCGLFGSSSSSSSDLYKGAITVGLTDNIPASGTYVVQNIYNPNVRQIIAVITVDNAKVGTKVEGQWYQMHVFPRKDALTPEPEGALVTAAGFQVSNKDNTQGRVTLTPNTPLPEDSYEIRIYVDGKLAKVQPFVVSNLVPGPATNTNPTPAATPAATPVRTPTPSR